jgi:hypothetical protein
MTNFLKRLFGGGSDDSPASEAAAPEPTVTPAEPAAPAAPPAPPEPPAEPASSPEATSDAGDEPA